MNEDFSTDKLKLAANFINQTAAPIFLTGKAGTGKTTFLRELAEHTYKNYIVVAPTGIAALHAKGVTIHSQFLLPLGSFLPVRDSEFSFSDQYGFFTQSTLARKHPLNLVRKDVLRALDLLVIDEVSMLRADVLDAVDFRLKSVKGNFQDPFGGVQVLLIGDLYQLPPIVKDQEWEVLRKFYASMHFFEAKALQQSGLVYLELDKIFRQSDEEFIQVLNHLRDNQVTSADIQLLNQHYKSQEELASVSDCITITTHNYKAHQINQRELQNLAEPSWFYLAEIWGDFTESLYPIPERLELRVGARIMFIKNDSSGMGLYFNGKLATVTSLDEDSVSVKMDGDRGEFRLRKEIWENKKYVVNPQTNELDEEVVGTFCHFPIKLAWAVTVHKSQGLTFEKAIIDVGEAFAPGQVYVALSRLKSLAGLHLRSRIQSQLLFSDKAVVDFSVSAKGQKRFKELLDFHRGRYLQKVIQDTFDFGAFMKELRSFQKDQESSLEFEEESMKGAIPWIKDQIQSELVNSSRFQNQLLQLLQKNDREAFFDRIQKGSDYYENFLLEIWKRLIKQMTLVSNFSKTKKYLQGLESLEQLTFRKISQIKKVKVLLEELFTGQISSKMGSVDKGLLQLRRQFFDFAKIDATEILQEIKSKTGRKKVGVPSPKRQKGDSLESTLQLFESGKSISEISLLRGLAESTIKSHLAEGIAAGRIDLEDCLPSEVILEILGSAEKYSGIKELREHFKGKYDYGTLKMVFAGNRNT
ncbi:MAG: helix-turn-helix domain-containing protein [Algoriphagus sp.]|uniref:helix-turn-helix domain-containing protein n=1 Tax=Algoriphagus sp. TaxID=1872435 RepID=UPI00180D0CAE|nr:helix-turn-helix domain-containing protein [Algoriphagus sp.]NVJ85675.1 helix-turn-helix domain-containing protein [Algoriphagus sp.]